MPWTDSPTVNKTSGITSAPAADALGSFADATPQVWSRSGWGDSLNSSTGGTTPITCTPSADAWGNLADAAPTIDLRGALTSSPSSDAWGNLADAVPTVDKRGILTAVPSADAWGNLSDSAPTTDRRGILTASPSSDALGSFSDSAPTTFATIAYAPSSDAWGNLADTTPTVATTSFVELTASLSSDALGSYADSAPTTDLRGFLTPSFAADSLGTYADAAPTIFLATPLTVTFSSDALGGYADAVPTIYRPGNRIATLSDAKTDFADSLTKRLTFAFTASDSLNAWVDGFAGAAAFPLSASMSDANAAYTDTCAPQVGYLYRDTDHWHYSSTPITVTLYESLTTPSDTLDGGVVTGRIYVSPSSDSLSGYADTLSRILGLYLDVREYSELDWTWGAETVDGFRIFYGPSTRNYISYYEIANPDARSVDLRLAVPPGEWYVAVAAYNSGGISPYSNEVIVSYSVYADSVVASTRLLNITDPKPDFVDALTVSLGELVLPAADAKDALADAISKDLGMPIVLAADSLAGYADSAVTSGHESFAIQFTDTMALSDTLSVFFTKDATPTTDAMAAADSVAKTMGSYVNISITVNALDFMEAYTDDVTVEDNPFNAIRLSIVSALSAYTDGLGGAIFHAASPDADATPGLADAVVWGDSYLVPHPSDVMETLADSVGVTLYAQDKDVALNFTDAIPDTVDQLIHAVSCRTPPSDDTYHPEMRLVQLNGTSLEEVNLALSIICRWLNEQQGYGDGAPLAGQPMNRLLMLSPTGVITAVSDLSQWIKAVGLTVINNKDGTVTLAP
jgi:hypothetical protein